MYAIYGNIYHQYTPFMLAYIPAPWILWVRLWKFWMCGTRKDVADVADPQLWGWVVVTRTPAQVVRW